ncbi:Eag protein [Vibrio parahaemolyticus]|jgi:uncharacterized Zn finger protein (UPF0148 family)|uniref:hypothetical protein n=1 Tax=Vibrio TaxID=662 RepID=UPI0005C79938|nr:MULTISPECIES: hypothetical protein [Vibrio]EGQ7820066.1 Eag protein [Vibrio parahaemolyticus]EGQ7821292.1 Eag protein [Vibrio parahaemolyticus]EGR0040984.1 Eag protein [Vibrio vulnificus]EGR0089567.1 Eag protein [Vibrio vulnificus]EGR7942547.1 Eag protein [Vibrio vulnificus]
MKTCPKCGSHNIEKERWHHAVKDAFEMGGDAALGQTGDLFCADCKYTSTPNEFEESSSEKE